MTLRVVMPLANDFYPDPRVAREARILVAAGYEVTVIAWDRCQDHAEREDFEGIRVIRIHSVPSAYGSGWRQILYLPRFWTAALEVIREIRPDIVHCHDLDTLWIGYRARRRWNTALIYDAHEHYPALMSLYLPAPAVPALSFFERWLLSEADGVITASTVLADELRQKTDQPVVTIGNYVDIEAFTAVDDEDVANARRDLGVATDQLLVAYIAGFARNRRILPLIEAAALCPDVAFHIWGDGLQRQDVEAAVAGHENAAYHGWVEPADLPLHFHVADIIYYCLRVDYPGAIYNAPNTLSQAMATGTPMIANRVGDLGRIIEMTGCGVFVEDTTPEAIAGAVGELRDPGKRAQLGSRGREAARERYNDESNRTILLDLYERLGRSIQR